MRRRETLIALGSTTTALLAGCLGNEEDPENTDGNGGNGDGDDLGSGENSNDGNENTDDGDNSDGDDEDDDTGPEELTGTRLRVSGRGQVETDPNQATVSLAVEAIGEEAGDVRDSLSEDAESVREALLGAGIEDDSITTTSFRIRERRQEDGYEGVHAYSVEIDDVDRVGEIVDVAVDAGADSVGRISYTIDDETREELREGALDRAIDDARAEAETVANSKEMEIIGVEEVSTDGHSVSPYRHRVDTVEADDAAAASTMIDQGPVSVSASVVVVYVVS